MSSKRKSKSEFSVFILVFSVGVGFMTWFFLSFEVDFGTYLDEVTPQQIIITISVLAGALFCSLCFHILNYLKRSTATEQLDEINKEMKG